MPHFKVVTTSVYVTEMIVVADNMGEACQKASSAVRHNRVAPTEIRFDEMTTKFLPDDGVPLGDIFRCRVVR